MEKSELKNIKLFVLDMDGTIYLGEKILPGAIEFVKTARETGRKVVFFTNKFFYGLIKKAKEKI